MIETNIIGLSASCLIDPLETGLQEKHFTNVYYKKIWSVILDLRHNKKTTDMITLSGELEKTDPSVNWFIIIGDAINEKVSTSSAKSHSDKLKSLWVSSEVKRIGLEMAKDCDNSINKYIKELMSLESTDKTYLHSFCDAAEDAITEIEKVMSGERQTVKTGLTDIDKITGGLHNSDLIIVAARPAMGKTAFMLNMASANKNRPLVFSTEQSRIQAMWRMFSISGNVPNHKIRQGDLDNTEFAQIQKAMNIILDSNGWIYDKSAPTMTEIETTAREVYKNHGCTAIYLDYLQRIKHENSSLPKHEQVGDIAMRLKELARELDIPVVALAQVNRRCEAGDNKRPKMGDIKDSGTIEQEADSIMTLYREEVYNEETQDKNICEVDFKKNRHGGTGMIKVKWTAPTMRFDDLTTMYY